MNNNFTTQLFMSIGCGIISVIIFFSDSSNGIGFPDLFAMLFAMTGLLYIISHKLEKIERKLENGDTE